jgi:hypothetical protein
MTDAEYAWLIAAAALAASVALLAFALTLYVIYRRGTAQVARDQILNYLKANDFTMMSLERIRDRINQDYNDEFLKKLPEYFPNQLRRAVLKDKDGALTRPGLARLKEDYVEQPGERAAH